MSAENGAITAEYSITVGDYRRACYYGLVTRNRRSLRFTVLIMGLFLVYAILMAAGFLPFHPVMYLIGAFYVVWLLLLTGSVERGIYQYKNSPDSLIGVRYRFTGEEYRILIEIPDRNFRHILTIKKITAFELSTIFLLYVDAQQVFIVPKRAFTDGQLAVLRRRFRTVIPDRFVSRYGS